MSTMKAHTENPAKRFEDNKMRKFILLLSVPLILAVFAISSLAAPRTDCKGGRTVSIKYGDSQIRVTPPLIKVNRSIWLKFKLRPIGGRDHRKRVTIRGEDRSKGTWLDVEGTADRDDFEFKVCVPKDQEKAVYKYSIEVEGVGTIDPRADVL